MATRDLNFNIFANDRASQAFARIAGMAEALVGTLVRLDRTRARPKVELDTTELERKIATAEAKLAELERKKANATIDADITLMKAKVDEAKRKLEELDKKRITPQVALDIAKVEGEIAKVQSSLDKLSRMRATPSVTMMTALAQQELARLQAELTRLNATRATPSVQLQMDKAAAELAILEAKLADLEHEKVSPKVDVDIAAASAKIAALKAELASIRDAHVNVRVDNNSIERSIGVLGRLGASITNSARSAAASLRAFTRLGLVIGALASLPNLASLGGSLVELSKAFILLPALATAAATGLATFAIAFSGLTKAIGPRDTEAQIKKADLAMSRLGVNAQGVAKAVIGLKGAWNELKQSVQNSFFENMGQQIKVVAATYLPMLKTGFTALGGSFNAIAVDFSAFLRRADTIQDTQKNFLLFRRAIDEARPSVTNLSNAWKDLTSVGATFLPVLAQGFSEVTATFANFIARARSDGSLATWMAEGIVAVKQFGSLLKELGGVFGGIFAAANTAGASFLETWTNLFSIFNDFVNSQTGQAGLQSFFRGIRDTVTSLAPGIKALLDGISNGIQAIEPAIAPIGQAFSAVADSIAPVFEMMGNIATQIITPIAAAVTGLDSIFGGLIPTVLTLVLAFKGMSVIGGLLAGLGVAVGNMATRIGLVGAQAGIAATGMNAMATAGTRVGNGISRLGNSLPLIGTAIIGLMILFDQFGPKADQMAQKVVAGSLSMQQAIQQEADRNAARIISWDRSAVAAESLANATQTVTAATEAHIATLSPMEQLQARVAMAQANLSQALNDSGEGSVAAAQASGDLAGAQARLKLAQDALANSTQSATDKLKAQADQMSAQASASLAFTQAMQQADEAQQQAQATVAKYGAGSKEAAKAVTSLAQQNLQVAESAKRVAADAGAADGGVRAYNTAIATTSTATQAGKSALIELASSFTQAQLDSISATAKMSGFKTEVLSLPGNKTVTVIAEADKQKAIEKMRADIEALNGKTVQIGADTMPVTQALTSVMAQIAGKSGVININGNNMPAERALQEIIGAISRGEATVKINGETVPVELALSNALNQINQGAGTVNINGKDVGAGQALAFILATISGSSAATGIGGDPTLGQQALAGYLAQIASSSASAKLSFDPNDANNVLNSTLTLANGATGTVTLDGNGAPVNAVIDGTKYKIDATTGIMTIDGNPAPGEADRSGLKISVDQTTGTITILGRDGGVAALKAQLSQPSSSTHTIYVREVIQTTGMQYAPGPQASGGMVVGFSGGGLVGFKRGGVLPGYAPGVDTIHAVLSRGEAVLVPEAVRALGAGRIMAMNREMSGGRTGTVTGSIAGIMDGTIGGKSGGSSGTFASQRSSWGTRGAVNVVTGNGDRSGEAVMRLISWLSSHNASSGGSGDAQIMRAAIRDGIRAAVAEARQVVINYTAGALSSNGVSSNTANDLRNLAMMGI